MSKADAGKEADKKKFDPRLVPTFLQKTYALVDSKDSREIVSWGAEPNTFVIFDPNRFAREVLPQYFKQNKMSSFVRQVPPTHAAQHVRLPQENLARQSPPRLLPPALPKGPGAPARQNQAQEELEEEQQGLHFPRPQRQRQAEAQPLPRRRTPRSPSTGTPRSTWSTSSKKLRSSSKTMARCSTPVASSRCTSTR